MGRAQAESACGCLGFSFLYHWKRKGGKEGGKKEWGVQAARKDWAKGLAFGRHLFSYTISQKNVKTKTKECAC